jgi:hypothetical protein
MITTILMVGLGSYILVANDFREMGRPIFDLRCRNFALWPVFESE